jgi:hypothetical protein
MRQVHATRGWRRVFTWIFTGSALVVAVGVLWQAFTIASYVRGAGSEARDLHVIGAYVTHTLEIVVFVSALVAFWGDWRRVGFALLLPLYGTFQVFVIGDTDEPGGWVNGLHGLLALVVLLQATVLALDGARHLYPRGGSYQASGGPDRPGRDAS